jgi:hypothetical protein
MSLTMYEASIEVLVHGLGTLSAILDKAAAHAEAKKIDPAIFVNARLAPDMFALARQVQIVSDTAKGCGGRLAGIDIPSFADTETSFPELQARIAKTVDFLRGIPAAKFDGSEDRTITMKLGTQEKKFSGRSYVLSFALPNFFFHITAAYAILRHNGIAVGKMDYLGL